MTVAELMASRFLFGIAEGILAREKAAAIAAVEATHEAQETAEWFDVARQSGGVSV